jgi:hypothetical protein
MTVMDFLVIFGAGDRDRTGDVQLDNFLSNLMFSSFVATAYSIFSAAKTFFSSSVISSGFALSTFVLETFWERGSLPPWPQTSTRHRSLSPSSS